MTEREGGRVVIVGGGPAGLTAAYELGKAGVASVVLIVDRAEVFPDNWIYVHDAGVRLGRVQNFKNWSADMVP
ncbi:MAG: FAD-dependent monooxygenase, partial [Acidobacteria bacterium]|nr:FAD-dependent monooxygenase [Acidobacteriota bacterium]